MKLHQPVTSGTVPLAKRPGDIAILVFFLVNLLFITYVVDIEQLIISDPFHFTYPLWPPPPAVDAIHWWGSTFDPVLMVRPAWWKMTIWIDALFFGPFYGVALYAFLRAREWIRLPSIVYAATMLTNVIIILGEEMFGEHATPQLPMVLLANLPWLLFPIYLLYRAMRAPDLFAQDAAGTSLPAVQTAPEQYGAVTGQ